MAAQNGFNPVPRSQAKILKGHQKESPYITITDIYIPDTPVVRAVDEYVKAELSPATYNHSVRVYFYGDTPLRSGLIIRAGNCSQSLPRLGIHSRGIPHSIQVLMTGVLSYVPSSRYRNHAQEFESHKDEFRVLRRLPRP
jgi:hypothetical protein